MEEFDPDREAVVARARTAGVRALLCPIEATSSRSRLAILAMTSAHPEIAAAAGLHPHQASAGAEEAAAAEIRRLAAEGKIQAVGEIGLDYHYDFAAPLEQQTAFRRQLSLARELALPVIVHSRKASRDILAAVDAERYTGGGVLHCFTEDWDFARSMLDRGFLVSFAGLVTFPKARTLRDVAARVPLDRLLIETDAPYLAPVPCRGRRNEPAYLVETARVLASLRNISLERLADATSANFRCLFGIPA
jgi:TatD DNase family protein